MTQYTENVYEVILAMTLSKVGIINDYFDCRSISHRKNEVGAKSSRKI